MSKLQQYAMLTAAALMTSNNKNLYEEEECYSPPKFFCKDCSYCPKGNKRFCKLAKHNVTKNTPVNKCEHFNYISKE